MKQYILFCEEISLEKAMDMTQDRQKHEMSVDLERGSKPDIAQLFASNSSWRCTKSGGNFKRYKLRNFCSQTLMGTK